MADETTRTHPVHGGSPSYKTKMRFATRATDEWKAWVEELASFCRVSGVPELTEHSLLTHAQKVGFKKPMPKRLG